MVDRDTIQAEYDEHDIVCPTCGDVSRIKQLERIIESFIAREAANIRVKGRQVIVRETPVGETPEQV